MYDCVCVCPNLFPFTGHGLVKAKVPSTLTMFIVLAKSMSSPSAPIMALENTTADTARTPGFPAQVRPCTCGHVA